MVHTIGEDSAGGPFEYCGCGPCHNDKPLLAGWRAYKGGSVCHPKKSRNMEYVETHRIYHVVMTFFIPSLVGFLFV